MKAGAGTGVGGAMGWKGAGIWAGDTSDGLGVFVSKQNHMHFFLTDRRFRRENDQDTSAHSLLRLQAGPRYHHTEVWVRNAILLSLRGQSPFKSAWL